MNIFEGRIEMYIRTDGQISLRKAPEGAYTAEDAEEILSTMIDEARSRNISIYPYAVWDRHPSYPRSDKTVTVTATRWGQPRVTLSVGGATGGSSCVVIGRKTKDDAHIAKSTRGTRGTKGAKSTRSVRHVNPLDALDAR